jgi:hypothetical protein
MCVSPRDTVLLALVYLLDLLFRPLYLHAPSVLDPRFDFPTSAGDFICGAIALFRAAVLVLAF